MRFLLDTNAVAAIIKRSHRVGERLRRHPRGAVGMSSIVRFELLFGAFRSERVDILLAAIEAVDLPTVPFEDDDARRAGELRARLRASGAPIGPYDLLIAGQALARDLVLVTHDMREFARVEGLRLEDWEA